MNLRSFAACFFTTTTQRNDDTMIWLQSPKRVNRRVVVALRRRGKRFGDPESNFKVYSFVGKRQVLDGSIKICDW